MRLQQIACRQQLPDTNAETTADSDWSQKPPPPEDCDTIAVNVRLLEPVQRYYVLGEVNAPGAYPLAGYETVLDAIVAAGGLTNTANSCKILLARPTDPSECRVTLPVCYREIVQLGNTASNYQLQPNDRIFVAARSCFDELFFWRAQETCPRCAGCNQPCRDSIFSTVRPMAMVEGTMIAPGSVGWRPEGGNPLDPRPLLDRARRSAPLPLPGAGQASPAAQRLPPPANSGSDVDGELDFAPFGQ
jgi:polysaccharide biosynthesis/export protein